MTEEEQKKASALAHAWAKHFDKDQSDRTAMVFQSLYTITRYALWLETQVPPKTTTLEEHSRPGWWSAFLDIFR